MGNDRSGQDSAEGAIPVVVKKQAASFLSWDEQIDGSGVVVVGHSAGIKITGYISDSPAADGRERAIAIVMAEPIRLRCRRYDARGNQQIHVPVMVKLSS